jgi:16S rRNA processing protein RimM
MNFDLTHHVQVAKASKPHGLKGEIKVYPFSENPENFKFYSSLVFVDPAAQDAREIKLLHSRSQGRMAVLTLSGVVSRNDADDLVDCEIWASRDDLPELADDEYYWNDFEGMEVYTAKDIHLGHVSSLMSTGAHDILVVSGRGAEYMIPVRDEFVVEINEADGKIIVDPPEGLLEINRVGK